MDYFWCFIKHNSPLALQMKISLTEIVHLAAMDSDSWVQMVADILKTFPDTGSLNLELEEHNQNLQEILGELREKGTFNKDES